MTIEALLAVLSSQLDFVGYPVVIVDNPQAPIPEPAPIFCTLCISEFQRMEETFATSDCTAVIGRVKIVVVLHAQYAEQATSVQETALDRSPLEAYSRRMAVISALHEKNPDSLLMEPIWFLGFKNGEGNGTYKTVEFEFDAMATLTIPGQ